MERRRYSVLGFLVLGACVVIGSGCGNKKEESPTSETASTATLTPEATVPPPVVPPPTAVVPPVTPPTPAKPPTPADPAADSRVVVACCVGMRTEAGRLTGTERTRMQNVARTCSDLASRVRKGESSKEKALSAVRAAGTGMKLPPACSG